ncbi:hypothetical protein SO802_015902 [Lithocarpus litseifolius]|uniref:Uncharacterized protein n=1 Tax=Lithocarpus litseifolius TaxID=425828 RepID=A0AAW2D0A9_9ROSI
MKDGDEDLEAERLRFECWCIRLKIRIQMLGSAGGRMASSLKNSGLLKFVIQCLFGLRTSCRLITSFMG